MSLVQYIPNFSDSVDNRDVRYVSVIMGQSNIDGRTDVSSLPVDIVNPATNVKIFDGGWQNFNSTLPPARDAPATKYAHDLLMLTRLAENIGQDVYCVKESRGGTSLQQSDNVKGDFNINSTGSNDLYLPLVRLINSSKNYVENVEGRRFVIPFLLMDIGETDSTIGDKTTFKLSATQFINAIKVIAENVDLPVIWRELGLYQTGVNQDFIDAQNELQEEITSLTLIPNTGLTLFDAYHLDDASVNSVSNQVLAIVEPLY
tara:strand:+ start:6637 stop:7416 length:780 start_codon:yes stop_codon:yes gene_type:complete